jgi:hypothetical protein
VTKSERAFVAVTAVSLSLLLSFYFVWLAMQKKKNGATANNLASPNNAAKNAAATKSANAAANSAAADILLQNGLNAGGLGWINYFLSNTGNTDNTSTGTYDPTAIKGSTPSGAYQDSNGNWQIPDSIGGGGALNADMAAQYGVSVPGDSAVSNPFNPTLY